MPRSLAPTSSIGCACERARLALNEVWLTLFSSIQSRVNLPDWMSLKHALHFGLGLGRHDARAGDIFAVFGGVRDRIIHVGDAALIDEVDDQLHFVQAFEIGHLRRIAGLDQRLEAARISSTRPPQSTACSPNRSVSHSSRKVVSMMPARPPPMAEA